MEPVTSSASASAAIHQVFSAVGHRMTISTAVADCTTPQWDGWMSLKAVEAKLTAALNRSELLRAGPRTSKNVCYPLSIGLAVVLRSVVRRVLSCETPLGSVTCSTVIDGAAGTHFSASDRHWRLLLRLRHDRHQQTGTVTPAEY